MKVQVLKVRFLIRADSRCKHDGDVRLFAAELIKRGSGEGASASKLAIPKGTAGKWVPTYQAISLDGLMNRSMSILFSVQSDGTAGHLMRLSLPRKKDALPSDAVFTQRMLFCGRIDTKRETIECKGNEDECPPKNPTHGNTPTIRFTA